MGLVAAQATRTNDAVISASADTTDFANLRDAINTYTMLIDVARTVTVTHTFTPTQTFTGGLTAGAAVTISTGGLTVTAGGATITAGNVAVTAGNLTFGAASAKVIPGATSLLLRNNADSASNIAITDAGAVTVRAGLTVTAGGAVVSAGGVTVTGNSTITGTLSGITTLTATTLTGTLSSGAQTGITAVGTLGSTTIGGDLTLSSATGKVLIGATSTTFRNSGDTADRLTLRQDGNNPVTIGASTSIGIDITSAGIGIRHTSGLIRLGPDATPTAYATNATVGFPMIPYCNGTPTGAVGSGAAGALIFDASNLKLYCWTGSAWKGTAAMT